MARIEYGLQLYSVRDITKEDFKGALKKVAELGYKYVEPAGFFGQTAEDVKAWLDEYGINIKPTTFSKYLNEAEQDEILKRNRVRRGSSARRVKKTASQPDSSANSHVPTTPSETE